MRANVLSSGKEIVDLGEYDIVSTGSYDLREVTIVQCESLQERRSPTDGVIVLKGCRRDRCPARHQSGVQLSWIFAVKGEVVEEGGALAALLRHHWA